ncbi:uncharacterized protein DS421_15g491770 [Arachis hypogaea]|nr:uncharacterized protein DS421_15g491770 [Arachis hypogaea]
MIEGPSLWFAKLMNHGGHAGTGPHPLTPCFTSHSHNPKLLLLLLIRYISVLLLP